MTQTDKRLEVCLDEETCLELESLARSRSAPTCQRHTFQNTDSGRILTKTGDKMCGIVGSWEPKETRSTEELRTQIQRMSNVMRLRGPDDAGEYVDATHQLALGHRRLSVLDLSAAGHQPMSSRCGRFQMIYNGEIYNHQEVRSELEASGTEFRGHSDTETVLEAIARFGIETTLPRLNGMFAFAVWDQHNHELLLVRDRLGIKPLYLYKDSERIFFASELKPFRQHPEFPNRVDRRSLGLLLRHGYIPAPHSIFQHVEKLPPGSLTRIRFADQKFVREETTWWSMESVAAAGLADRFSGSLDEATDELERLLTNAAELRLLADVPVGAFLSGGIDSSTVVAMLQKTSARQIQTFTIGFEEAEYNEADTARKIAKTLGTKHTTQIVTAKQALQQIPQLPAFFDEPFADSSQIPTVLVSELARQQVTVCLSGDGGDELFGGYARYQFMQNVWRKTGWLPQPLRTLAGKSLKLWPETIFGSLGRKCSTLAEVLQLKTRRLLYATFNTHWKRVQDLVVGIDECPNFEITHSEWTEQQSFIEEMMWLDTVTYLPDDILTKVDRASMAMSLEARVPLLDHRIMEFAWTLPAELKFSDTASKLPLRNLLARYLSPELFAQEKRGFGVPIDHWLRGPLRAWAEELLDEQRLLREGFFHPQPIRQKWHEHQQGQQNWHYYLWDILMFQSWWEWWNTSESV